MKAILFDFDGTLVDTQILYNTAISQTLSRYNSKFTVEYCSNYFEGKCWHDAFETLSVEENFCREAVFNDGLTLAKKMISAQAKVTNGTLEVLPLLQKQGIKMAICSNSHREEIFYVLKKVGLDSFFEDSLIFGRDLVIKGKPSSEVYLLALEAFNIKPENALAVEDSVNGAKASLDANIPTAIFTGATGFHGINKFNEAFQKNLPYFGDMQEIMRYVNHG